MWWSGKNLIEATKNIIWETFFCGGRGLNPCPCIYYSLSIPTELSSGGLLFGQLNIHITSFFCEGIQMEYINNGSETSLAQGVLKRPPQESKSHTQ